MYKVLCDNALMCDSRIDELALINPVIDLEENKAGSFSFTLTPDHPMYDAILQRKSVLEVYQDDELKFCGICIEVTTDFYKQKKVYCEGELTYFNDSIQRPARYQGFTVRGLLEAYIANHNAQVDDWKKFTVGMVTVTDPNDSLYCYSNMESTLQCLKNDLVDDLGGFFRIRHVEGVRYLDYLADSQNTNSQVIRFGKNLMDFSSNINSADIATAIIPLGAIQETRTVEGLDTRLTIESVNEGKDYVFSQDAVDTFGWIYKTVEFDNITTPSALKAKGERYLSDTQFQNMILEAKVIDLHLTDKEIECFKISDQIRVVSAPHGLDRFFRLTKMTINLNNPANNTITLGKDEKVSISAKTSSVSDTVRKAIESITPPSTVLQQAIDNATQLITNAMGGYIYKTHNELYIMDTDNPETAQRVWRWNINGLGFSSTGINGQYGLAMTMDGAIVCDALKGGKINGQTIEGGTITGATITSKNNNTFIKVANGAVSGGIDDAEHGYISFESNIRESGSEIRRNAMKTSTSNYALETDNLLIKKKNETSYDVGYDGTIALETFEPEMSKRDTFISDIEFGVAQITVGGQTISVLTSADWTVSEAYTQLGWRDDFINFKNGILTDGFAYDSGGGNSGSGNSGSDDEEIIDENDDDEIIIEE